MHITLKGLLIFMYAQAIAGCGSASDNSQSPRPEATSQIASPTPSPATTVPPAATPVVPGSTLATLTITEAEIPNFHQVSPAIYRSGEPTTAAWAKLKAAGLKTVVSLVSTSIGDSDQSVERALATAAGLQYINIPMDGLLKPKIDQINLALQTIVSPQNQPILVHCTHGADRTGIVIASYRIKHDLWSVAQATTDMYTFGHSKWLSWWDSVLKDVK